MCNTVTPFRKFALPLVKEKIRGVKNVVSSKISRSHTTLKIAATLLRQLHNEFRTSAPRKCNNAPYGGRGVHRRASADPLPAPRPAPRRRRPHPHPSHTQQAHQHPQTTLNCPYTLPPTLQAAAVAHAGVAHGARAEVHGSANSTHSRPLNLSRPARPPALSGRATAAAARARALLAARPWPAIHGSCRHRRAAAAAEALERSIERPHAQPPQPPRVARAGRSPPPRRRARVSTFSSMPVACGGMQRTRWWHLSSCKLGRW